jgi:hypothetical protein
LPEELSVTGVDRILNNSAGVLVGDFEGGLYEKVKEAPYKALGPRIKSFT